MTDEAFIEATKVLYIALVRASDDLTEDSPVGLPARFNLDARYHKNNEQTPQETAELIYRAETM